MKETNWAGNVQYSAPTPHQPTSLDELQSLVRAAPKAHVLGSRHTFNRIADATELVSLADLPQQISIDAQACTASVPGGMRYGVLAKELQKEGYALHNLASLPQVSVAGAVATGTHGSGDRNGSLATAVVGLELVRSDGELIHVTRGDPDFDGTVVHLGALGAVTRLTLEVQPTYEVRQTVYERLAWPALLKNFDAVTASGYSVSLFTTYGGTIEQVWVKERLSNPAPELAEELFGAPAATVDLHPAAGLDPLNCTLQLGRPGPWSQRLTHFGLEYMPSVGNELQSEYMVTRADAPAAIEAIREIADRIRPLLIVGEIRTVAADALWLSPEYGRDTVCFHFTWQPDQPSVEALLLKLEAALSSFDARPHWGKLFHAPAESIRALYPRMGDFLRLKERLDPRGAFTNAWFTQHVG